MKLHARLNLKALCRLCILVASLMTLATNVHAQTSNIGDGTTSPSIAPGAPAGSYPLTDIEVLNVYNGNVSLRFPLITIGGRGSAQHVVTLPIEQRWTVDHTTDVFNGMHHQPSEGWWFVANRYTAGRMLARQACESCPSPNSSTLALTRLTFSAPDGTEYELRDSVDDGAPEVNSCGFADPHFNRGRVFKTVDGTAATFISDTDVHDFVFSGTVVQMSGYFYLRDGTCYRFDNGDVTFIRDRNGNKISFSYNGAVSMTITDALNREVFVEYNVTQGSYGLCDRITFKGFGGTTHQIHISKKSLSDVLRHTHMTDASGVQTYFQLFPELIEAYRGDYNPSDRISKVWLPDGRSYQIFYNVYGEVARVILPTGGAMEYDWQGGEQGGNVSGVTAYPEIYRKVVTKRLYADTNITSLISTTTFSKIPNTAASDVTVQTKDASDQVVSQSKHYFYTNAVNEIVGSGPVSYPAWREGKEYQTEALAVDASVLRRETSNWQQPDTVGWWQGGADFGPTNNPRIIDKATILTDVSPNLVSTSTFAYDDFLNITDTCDYDFGPDAAGPLLRHSHTSYLTLNSVNNTDYTGIDLSHPGRSIHLRSLPETQIVNATCNDNTTSLAMTEYEYDNYTQEQGTNPNHAPLTTRSGISGHDDTVFAASRSARGNATSIKRWIDSTASASTFQFYDVAGSVVKNKDALQKLTTFDYDDRFGIPSDDEARNNTAPSWLNTQTSFAFATHVKNALNHEFYTQYDYYLGKPVNFEDANLVVASLYYESGDDKLDRPLKLVSAANFDATKTQTLITYDDTGRTITTSKDLTSFADGQLTAAVIYDGLGRTIEMRSYEPGGYIATTHAYDALGRPSSVKNPFRTTTEDTYGTTVTGYDALSRVVRVETFDRNSVSTGAVTSEYAGNTVTVTDQAGKKRRSLADALGRLTRVDEPDAATGALDNNANPPQPVQPTSYVYDALSNLTTVTQQSGATTQTRRFAYDKMSRLIFAANPEQNTSNNQLFTDNSQQHWAVRYEYDAASNLTFKYDTRMAGGEFVKTTLVYGDDLHRLTSRSYNDGTATVTYSYDTATKGVGRLASVVANNVSTTSYTAYDPLGRLLDYNQQTASQTYTMSRAYNRAGLVISDTYPSQKVIQTEYDTAGRIAGVSRGVNYYAGALASDSTNRIHYSPAGAVDRMKLGNGLWEHTDFNSRLQPGLIGLGSSATTTGTLKLEYDYGSTGNNGNVLSQKITAPTASGTLLLTENYTYDKLNRLLTANEKVNQESSARWTQTFTFDRWGNRTGLTNTGELPAANQLAVNPATNRFSSVLYDEAGNQLRDEANHPLTYDAENHQKSFTAGGITYNYSYDGDGRRVKRDYNDGTAHTTIFVYNASGQLIAEYTSDPVPPPQGSGGVSYLTTDHLGSTRVVTSAADGSGNVTIKARHDYLPFGEDIGSTVSSRPTVVGYNLQDGLRQKFTQKERDNESGLDYFLARYYSSMQGRFTSADPSRESVLLTNPQSWNRYLYCLDNPLANVDHNGEWPTRIHELIIDRAFPALWSGYRSNLKMASARVDGVMNGGQSSKYSYTHGMRAPGQSIAEAAKKASDYINENRVKAMKEQNWYMRSHQIGLSDKALEAFGRALHTVTDMTSPTHEGFQVWYGLPIPGTSSFTGDSAAALVHSEGEAMISPERLGLAIGASLTLFEDTFGTKALREATGNVIFGSENDPSVQAIHAQYSLPGSNALKEAEALHSYRYGLQRGRQFNFHLQ